MFEYVMSGTNHINLPSLAYNNDKNLVEFTKECFEFVKSKTNHSYALLFNAYQEKRFIDALNQYRPHIDSMYSDSGGLQLAQKSIELTDDVANSIYDIQCNNSDIAMTFDVMPLVVVEGMDAKVKMSAKKFIVSKVKEAGEQSGDNIVKQIEVFKKIKEQCSNDGTSYDCKLFIVIHGNSPEDYKLYFYSLISRLDKSMYCYIGGYALAATTIGNGSLEAFDSLFAFLMLDLPPEIPKHIHLLGYGRISRMMPVLSISKTLLKDWKISYDSTTHTLSPTLGQVFDKNLNSIAFGTKRNPKSEKVYSYIYDMFEHLIRKYYDNIEKQEFVDITNSELVKWSRYSAPDREGSIHRASTTIRALMNIIHFTQAIDSVSDDIEKAMEYGVKNIKLYRYVRHNITSPDQWYSSVRSKVAKYLVTDRVERIINNEFEESFSLDSFF